MQGAVVSATTHAPPIPAAFAARGLALLILVSAAQFMVTVDVTVVNLATPSIGASLGFAAPDLSWILTIYTLVGGSLLLLGGRAADLFGARRIFLAGLVVFTGASLLAGLAQSEATLIGARAAQGAGAAMLSPGALAVLVGSFSGAERTRALAVWGAVASAGAAVGVLLGGMLTSWASWRWAFLINVPVGLAAGVAALRMVPRDTARKDGSLDVRGAAALVTGLLALVYAIERAPEDGWVSAQTLVLAAVAASALLGFAALERRAPHPLVPPGTLRARTLSAGVSLVFAGTGLLIGLFFLGSLYMQRTLGLSAVEAGLGFLPAAVMIGVMSHVTSHLLPRVGTRATAVAGLALAAGGNLLLSGMDPGGSYAADVLPGLLVTSAGVGLVFVTASVTAMHEVGHDRAGLASGLMTTAHEIGAALGVAVLGAIAAANALGDAFLVAGIAGAAGAVLALAAFPAVRPGAGARAMMH
jgi:EmrB/QacA subfamily drug resistance transporter